MNSFLVAAAFALGLKKPVVVDPQSHSKETMPPYTKIEDPKTPKTNRRHSIPRTCSFSMDKTVNDGIRRYEVQYASYDSDSDGECDE